ncbi:hypothetical protein LINPERHAP1_LOCUS21511 [Linum perenne]
MTMTTMRITALTSSIRLITPSLPSSNSESSAPELPLQGSSSSSSSTRSCPISSSRTRSSNSSHRRESGIVGEKEEGILSPDYGHFAALAPLLTKEGPPVAARHQRQ